MPYRKKRGYTTKPKKGRRPTRRYRRTGFTKSAPRSTYRTPLLGAELQLTNRRPQSMTTKLSIIRTYYVRPEVAVNNWSFLRVKCGTPYEPWGTGSAGQFQTGRWQLQSFVDSTIFDQFKDLYEEAYVLGSKCTAQIKFIGQRNIISLDSNPNELQQVVAVGIQSSDDSQQGAIDPDDLPSTVVKKQNFRVSRCLIGGNSQAGAPNFNSIAQGVNHKQVQQSAFYSPKKLFGIKDVGDYDDARFDMNPAPNSGIEPVPPMYGAKDLSHPYKEGPYFTIGLAHECDDLGGDLARANHNDAYVTVKVDYIMKMVKPTPDRGFNYRNTML